MHSVGRLTGKSLQNGLKVESDLLHIAMYIMGYIIWHYV